MEKQLLCQKDNQQIEAGKGCPHRRDFCPYRQSCIIHYLEQEKIRSSKKEDLARDS